jgi:hypothetical protein
MDHQRAMQRSWARSFALTALIIVMGSCGDPGPPAITVGAVSFQENELLGLTDARRQTLADLAAFGLAVADSTTNQLGTPLVDEWVDNRRLEVLAAHLTLEKNGVGDAVLEAQYQTDPQWELIVRHILFFSERWRSAEHRAEARAKASRAMESLRAGADFEATAAELSEEPGAEGRQGLLTPGREGSWVPEFWAAALALEPGQISPVTETQYGYHILRLEGREVIPFAEARSVVARSVADRIEDPDAVLTAWMAGTGASQDDQRDAALREARRRSLEVPVGEQAELSRVWDDQVYQWSATLGFRYGLSTTQVTAAALAALSDPSQGATLARSELGRRRSLLAARYDTRFTPPGS